MSDAAPERPLAVITGASSGIGAEFARQLAARGYRLLLAARRADRLRALAEEFAAARLTEVEIMAVDLASDEGRERLAARIRNAPGLALVVNNAGFGSVGLFPETSLELQDRMHRLHVLTTLALSHAALNNPSIRARGGSGRPRGIINVSSVAAFEQSPSNVSYCATKTWMNSFTQGLAIELAMQRSPVRVQALCPGFTDSEFHERINMDRGRIPKSLWTPTAFVVSESLRGFDEGRLIVVPGWRYKLIAAFLRMMPAGLMLRIVAHFASRYRRTKPSAEAARQ
jgi:short-subunit dehydrogenase